MFWLCVLGLNRGVFAEAITLQAQKQTRQDIRASGTPPGYNAVSGAECGELRKGAAGCLLHQIKRRHSHARNLAKSRIAQF